MVFRSGYANKDGTVLKTTHFYINIDDVSSKINNTLTFGYTNSENVVVCPDFTFDKWIECGIDIYNKTITKIIENGNKKHAVEKLFWIGILNNQSFKT